MPTVAWCIFHYDAEVGYLCWRTSYGWQATLLRRDFIVMYIVHRQ